MVTANRLHRRGWARREITDGCSPEFGYGPECPDCRVGQYLAGRHLRRGFLGGSGRRDVLPRYWRVTWRAKGNSMTTPEFIPPARPIVGEDEIAAVTRVIRSGMLAQGPEVQAFELEFSQVLELDRACVAVNSGTSGLHLGLLTAGIGPGDEVIVPSFTFAATANAVALTGATPVFADIEADTFCLDPRSAEEAITGRTKAIMPVHLYGHPIDMPAFEAIATTHGLRLFEDAAQAHGASLNGRPVGTLGDFAMFSLYPTKNMTSGEGGMVSCADELTARTMRLLRNQGMEQQYRNELVGFNARMTDLHAAIGRVQLSKVLGWNVRRRENASRLSAELIGVVVPPVRSGAVHAFHQYTIRIPEDRDGLASALRSEYNIGTGIYYPVPIHQLAPFGADIDLPNTADAAAQVLSLPIGPTVAEAELDRIIEAVNALAGAGG